MARWLSRTEIKTSKHAKIPKSNNLKKSKKRKFDENKNDENEKQPRKSIRLRNKKAPQPCQLCGFTTDNPKTMIEHVETAHPS